MLVKLTDESLSRVANLASKQLKLEAKLKKLLSQVNEVTSELDFLKKVTLPELMRELGLKRFDLKTGEKVIIKDVIGASIKVENRQKAFAWLREHGFDSLIKHKVTINFNRGEETNVEKTVSFLKQQNLDPKIEESVHPQTLSAFVREQMMIGNPLPTDILGVYSFSESKIIKKGEKNGQEEEG